jgi:hypothetical protein
MPEHIETLIDNAIQSELSYDKDYITNDGWEFLENEAKEQTYNAILKDYDDDDIDTITSDAIESYLSEVIYEYEQTHANIRYYD